MTKKKTEEEKLKGKLVKQAKKSVSPVVLQEEVNETPSVNVPLPGQGKHVHFRRR